MGLLSRSGWSRRLTDIHKMSQSLCPSNFWEPPLTVNALYGAFTWDQIFLHSMPIPKIQAYISSKYLQNVGYYLWELVQFCCFDISCKPHRYYLLIYLSTLLEDSKRYTKETRSERDTCTPMFIAALFIIARTWKQPRCPSADERIRKLW